MIARLNHREFLSLAEEILKRGKKMRFVAEGTSMAPFIRDGDTVVVAPAKRPFAIGDVILFKTVDDRIILHRIVRKQGTAVVTQGDASFSEDGIVPCENILGLVIEVSGRGYNFHLRQPYKFLIGKRLIVLKRLERFPSVLKFGRSVANVHRSIRKMRLR